MLKKTELREAALSWIKQQPSGTKFTYSDLYNFLEDTFPTECSQRGNALNEPRYKHDARCAVWDAMPIKYGLIRHTGIRGQRQRI
jgi:hypothetical protein